MRFSDLARPARVYVVSIVGLALLTAELATWQGTPMASVELFSLLVLAATVAHSFPVSLPGKQAYHVSLPFFVAAVILLAPPQLVALVATVHLVDWFKHRRSPVIQVFNTATFLLSGLLAQAMYRALWSGPDTPAVDLKQSACLVAGLAAVLTFGGLNRVLVSGIIWLGHRISPRNQHLFDAESLLTDGVLLLMGVPLAHQAQIAPWAAAAGAAPLWLIHRALDLPNVRAQSRRDGLTELFTASYMIETCSRELNRALRFNRPVSLLLLDVDHLGDLNTEHGQQAGDAVLRGAARTICAGLREYDVPARMAGGLFAVLLPETDLAAAQGIAERIRRATAEERYEIPNSIEQAQATLSVGGSVVFDQNVTATQFFDAARRALARAKDDGGNQVGFEAVAGSGTGALTQSTADEPRPAAGAAESDTRERGPIATWFVERRQSLAVLALATLALGVSVVGAIADLDWPLVGAMLGLAALAGLAVYFKILPLALAGATELNYSPARLAAARHWRMWPRYAALGIGGVLAAYAYVRLGLAGAAAIGACALFVRHQAGLYIDRTLDGVRQLRSAKEALEHQAFHDPLTGLANRALFAERLEQAMLRAGEDSIAVLFLDLDNFKTINDTLGHAAGDVLLTAVTARLLRCVRREDTIARLGGDEFTILLESMHDPSDAARMAERISEALCAPFEQDGQQIFVSSSIGIALDTDRSHRADDLLREADLAMYRAKAGGRARYEIFDTRMAERAMERLELESELRQAVERRELELTYEPVVSLSSGAIDAFEVRLGWRHPRRGLLELIEFLPVAEDTGLIVDLGAWALEQACQAAQRWQALRPGVLVEMRLSARQLDHPGLVDGVEAALVATGLPAGCLRLSVPEASLAADPQAVATLLDALTGLGVRMAVDDVGAGVSSLASLSQLPVDTLKIGSAVGNSPGLVRASVALAAALEMTLTVRGIQHPDEAARLAAVGCRRGQGALYGAAISAQAVEDLLARAVVDLRAA